MNVELQISESFIKEAVSPVPGEDKQNNQGIGTDLFVRKNLPGSQVGRGYTVDVFENGIKVDTIVEHNKERVLELVKKYKQFYHTDRAFQNEIQLHVTYKRRKDEEKGAMDISKELTKRASRIQELSQKLIFPNEMIKKFADDLNPDGIGAPPIHQVTPSEAMNETAPSESVDSISKKTIQKLVDYISSNMASDDGVLYNELKKWYKALGDIISENNQANPDNELDRNQIAQKVKEITLSGDPSAYTEIGIEIAPDIAQRIQEVNGKAVSSKGGDVASDAAVGGETTAENEINASFTTSTRTADAIDKFLGGMRRAEDGIPLSEKDNQFIKDNASEIISKIPDGGTEEQSSLKSLAEQSKNPAGALNPLQPVSQVQQPHVSASEFFKFVKTAGVIGDLDKVFLSWASCRFSSLEELGAVWSEVYAEATGAFSKTADMQDIYDQTLVPDFKEGLIALYQSIMSIIDQYKIQAADGSIILSDDMIKDTICSQAISTFKSNYAVYNNEFLTSFYNTERQKNTKDTVMKLIAAVSSNVNKYLILILKDINSELGLTDNLIQNFIFKNVLVEFNTQLTTYMQQNIESKYDVKKEKINDRFKGR